MTGGAGLLRAVGVGPGALDLITLRGAEAIRTADVVAYYSGTGKSSVARSIASDLITPEVIEEELRYPVTTGETAHAGGYYGAITDFYDESADRLAAHLDQGRTVVLLAEGDPLFYSSFMYLHDRLAPRYRTEVIPGVTSVSAATAAAATTLCRHEDVVTVLPGTLPVPELARRLADTQAAVIMKLGRTFAGVREALRQAGCLDRAIFVERASSDRQRVLPVSEVDADSVAYMSIVVVPGRDRRADGAGRAHGAGRADGAGLAHGARRVAESAETAETAETAESAESTGSAPATQARVGQGSVTVIGLGPGPEHWLTPQSAQALTEVEAVYGYAPYVARVPVREGLSLHSSGNTVELDRAREALEAALAGGRVAVVSGGDAGVFGMASAVFEAAADPRFADVAIRVLPGVTAANAAAALAGAPLGADYAVLSLSDRLKPWEVLAGRLRAAASADLAIAIYNPRSRSRPDQLGRAVEVLRELRGPETVVSVARHVGRAEESLAVTTLGEFDPETVDMGCLVMIGASATTVTAAGQVWTPRFVSAPDAAAGGTPDAGASLRPGAP